MVSNVLAKEIIMALVIAGPNVRKVLGKDVDLNLYNHEETSPPEILTGTFDHVGWFDLDTVDPDDVIWYQDGIREAETDQFTQLRLDQFTNSYETEGWLTKFIPPMFTLVGKPIDGRGRILSLYEQYKLGLTGRYAPAFFYTDGNDSVLAEITDGLSNNLRHNPAFKATRESVITGTCVIIGKGELEFNEVAVRNYLYTQLKIEKHFNQGNITTIVNGIMKRGASGGDPLVRVEIRGKHVAFCERAGCKIDNKKTILLCCDSDTYAYRAWCQHILPAITKNNDPVKIILFTNNHVPAEARKKIKAFKNFVEYFVDASYLMVEKAKGCSYDTHPQPFELLGCIPQIVGAHDAYRKGHRLVPIYKY